LISSWSPFLTLCKCFRSRRVALRELSHQTLSNPKKIEREKFGRLTRLEDTFGRTDLVTDVLRQPKISSTLAEQNVAIFEQDIQSIFPLVDDTGDLPVAGA